MKRVISLCRHEYGGRWYDVGDELDIEDQNLEGLMAIGRVQLLRDKNGTNLYETRALAARPPGDGRGRPRKAH